MKTLNITLKEGILDVDDVTVDEIKNWPRFCKRLSGLKGRKYDKVYFWTGTEVLEALTDGLKMDVGGRKVSKSAAWKASVDCTHCIIAAFTGPGGRYASTIYVGNNDGAVCFEVAPGPMTRSFNIGWLSNWLNTIEARNWTIRLAPTYIYKLIMNELT